MLVSGQRKTKSCLTSDYKHKNLVVRDGTQVEYSAGWELSKSSTISKVHAIRLKWKEGPVVSTETRVQISHRWWQEVSNPY